jgi:hypothetical protein
VDKESEMTAPIRTGLRRGLAAGALIGVMAAPALAVQASGASAAPTTGVAAATSVAAPTTSAAPAPRAAAAAKWKSWRFDVKTTDKRPGGRAAGAVSYKAQGVKKKYGTCYYAKITTGKVFDTDADGRGAIAYLIYTDCRNGRAVRATAGYAAPKGDWTYLNSGTHGYATKAGVKICLRKDGSDTSCRTKR